MHYLQDLTQDDLVELLKPQCRADKPRQAHFHARQIFQWVYQRHVTEWEKMTDLSKMLREWLVQNVKIARLEVAQHQRSTDGTQKFLWRLEDGNTIESVIIPADTDTEADAETETEPAALDPTASRERVTACISSQVGCAMGCRFCLTGTQGLTRNLKTHEIIAQVLELRMRAPISNIVFMGMGEPLHNVDNVIQACRILLDPVGLGFSKRKVTVSTSGLVTGIQKLGQSIDVSLAISLNSSYDEQRSSVMPVNKKWNIQALMDVCRQYPVGSHRRITFEYVLLGGVNDTLEDADRLVRIVRGLPAKINLICYNPHPGSDYKRPEDAHVRLFQKYLLDRNVVATLRQSRGRDILAACGQLKSSEKKNQGL